MHYSPATIYSLFIATQQGASQGRKTNILVQFRGKLVDIYNSSIELVDMTLLPTWDFARF